MYGVCTFIYNLDKYIILYSTRKCTLQSIRNKFVGTRICTFIILQCNILSQAHECNEHMQCKKCFFTLFKCLFQVHFFFNSVRTEKLFALWYCRVHQVSWFRLFLRKSFLQNSRVFCQCSNKETCSLKRVSERVFRISN